MTGILGIIVFVGIAWLLSDNRKAISYRIVIWGFLLQIIFAVMVLGVPSLKIPGLFKFVFDWLNGFVMKVLSFSDEGARFVFGPLSDEAKTGGFVFAIKVLPTIIFFSTLVAVFYHLGILQRIIYGIAWVMKKFMPVGGPETLSTAANVFLGQTEAPLLIKPYLATMTNSSLLCIMIGGMANVAGGVMAAYVALLHTRFPDIAGHLLTVSIMSAPATLLISKIMMPDRDLKKANDKLESNFAKVDTNAIEAATRGASEGLSLALNVAAMLIAFTALVYMANGVVGWLASLLGYHITLQQILGWVFSPLAWLLGTPVSEISAMGRLLGEKIVLNEFVAYISLSDIGSALSDRTVLIASYALCGFANIASIGIQVGGIGAMAPERRADLAKLGVKALIGGNLATFICAALVGLLY